MRTFDIRQQFAEIQKAAQEAAQTVFPVNGRTRTVHLKKIWVEDNLSSSDFQSQAKVKSKDGTFGVPIYAHLELVDNTTKEIIDSNKKLRLFMLPKITDRFSYIVKGNEYQVHNQLRLKPGVYTLQKQNGELKTQVNLAKGKNFDIIFNDKKNQFFIAKVGGGQANIPLYPVLIYLGLSHSAIEKAWGTGLAAANKDSDPKIEERLKKAFGVTSGSFKDYLKETEISPETTKSVLGTAFDKVDGSLLLSSSKDLLKTKLGKKEPTDRDSLEFKEIHSVEDFIKERLLKNQKTLAFKIRRNIDSPKKTKLSQIVNPTAFSSTIESFFTQDDKSATPEQTNPLEMLTGHHKTTIMGSGGIKQEHAITDNMREVHSSHFGFIDPIHTPESSRIGANLHMPIGVIKDGKELKTLLFDRKGNKGHYKPSEVYHKIVAMPGEKGETVKAMHMGKTIVVPRTKVDLFSGDPKVLFSYSTNLVPFLASNQGNRAMMASKMLEQAISLKHREAPLVQVKAGQNSMEGHIGKTLTARAPEDGVVTKVDSDSISIKTKNGVEKVSLYNNFTLNRKSFMNHESTVKVGDTVKKGQNLADSNYTKGGELALGINARVAYLPYKGLNFEDGIVITESASEKLTSEHIHKKHIDLDDNTVLRLSAYKAIYPNVLTGNNLKKLDNDGIIRVGETIKHGEALIASLRKTIANTQVALVKKQLADRPKDNSLYWPYEDDGKVIDVKKTAKKITIFIKTEEKAKIGDKLSGRMGNKGIITKIIPDSHAPKTKDGEAAEILLNPHGVISRINIGQIYESAAGKAAKKNGKTHLVENFSGEDYRETTEKILRDAGISDKEEMFDGETGKSLGKVHIGNPYVLKLFKQSTSNFSAREGGPGNSYDLNMQPVKSGGEDGSKSLDLLSMYAMLSHGARANLREMSTLKSNQNDEHWKALKSGSPLPPPKSPFVYEKFMEYLKGAGIDTVKKGSTISLAPLTDKQVAEMSNLEIKDPRFYRAKDQEPIKNGFLDQRKLGGFQGGKWGHIELKEPVVNPVFETAVRKLTGVGNKYDDIMGGKLHINDKGEFNEKGQGVTGGLAIEKLLKKIDVEKDLDALIKKALKAKGSQLDSLNKQIRYLKNLKDLGLSPDEAYIRKKVPVIPPKYRPIYPMPDGNMMNADVNSIYNNLGVVNKMMELPVMDLLPEEDKQEARKDLNEHVKSVSGLTDLNIKGRVRDGFISEIKGGHKGQPKEGFFLSKVISKKQDFVGRGTIIPEPDLGVDEVALPEQMAWKLFEPFVIRELKSHGKTPLQAIEEIKNKTPLAKKVLDLVMKDRKVLLNRAPSLHKFSVMAFKPKITDGKAIKIPPLVVDGFNADFDGDTMTVHVPISNEANKEADKMLPSNNLYKPGSGKLMINPSQEAQIGIFYLSKSQQGRAKLNKILPKEFAVTQILDKNRTKTLLMDLSKKLENAEFAEIVAKLKSEGETEAFGRGFTLGMDDLKRFDKDRDKIVSAVTKLVNNAKSPEELANVNTKAQKLMDGMITKGLKGTNNPLFDMVESGARGSMGQLRQILASPIMVTDAKQRIVPSVITKSYAEGLDIGDYWTSMYGARRGMMDRALQTSLPGAFSKDIMATTIDNVISTEDCGVSEGRIFPVDSQDLTGRFLAKDQAGFAKNTLVDQKLLNELKKKRISRLEVRSPLKCLVAKGTCSKCYGIDEHGSEPEVGSNIGAKAGQTISEPLVQLVMNTFHTGGTAGSGSDAGGYKRIEQLLHMPKVVVGAAPLSPTNGLVEKITKGLAGGYDVIISGKKEHVPQGRNLKVKVGQMVKKGDPLSDGVIKPQDLVKYKGMEAAQEYVADELHKAYGNQGVQLDRKVFETVVRSAGNTTQVLNNPKDSNFVPGDIIPYTIANNYNKNLSRIRKTDEARGEILAKRYGPFKEGHKIALKDVNLLKALGHKEVEVTKDAIQHAPTLRGISTLPLLRKDWMAALGYRNLAKALTEGAGQGWSTDLEGYHPIPAFARGSEFGKGEEGKY